MENIALAAPAVRINARLIEQIPIGALMPYPDHARLHSEKQIAKLSRSIRRFGIVAPILIDESNVIIAGHAVVGAAKLLGLDEVPALRVEHLAEAEKRALRLALNRLAEDAEWDPERLATELRFLVDADFEIDVTGFEAAEIDFHLKEDRLRRDSDPAPEDELPAVATDAPTVTRPGDIWILGRHRLFCGCPQEEASYRALLTDERAAVACASPPDNVTAVPVGGRGITAASGALSRPEYTTYLTACFQLMAAHSADGAIHFIWTGDRRLSEMVAATDATYSRRLTVAVWDKMVGGASGLYRNQHELVFVEMVGTAPITNNAGGGRQGRHRATMWTYHGLPNSGVDSAGFARQPLDKPVALVADAILDMSRRDDIVLDPFAGSGTTVLAAHKTGRRARVMEVDAHMCDVAVRRWQAYAAEAAVDAETGLTFAEMTEQRHRTPEIVANNLAGVPVAEAMLQVH